MMGVVIGRILVAGALVVKKWLVAPESRMAHLFMVLASVLIVFSCKGIVVGGDQTRVCQINIGVYFLVVVAPNRQNGGGCWYVA
jgi:hypothetical protein